MFISVNHGRKHGVAHKTDHIVKVHAGPMGATTCDILACFGTNRTDTRGHKLYGKLVCQIPSTPVTFPDIVKFCIMYVKVAFMVKRFGAHRAREGSVVPGHKRVSAYLRWCDKAIAMI